MTTISLFSKDSIASNLFSVAEYKTYAKRALGLRSWKSAAKHIADHRGIALVLLNDDSLLVIEACGGKFKQKTFKPNTWAWA